MTKYLHRIVPVIALAWAASVVTASGANSAAANKPHHAHNPLYVIVSIDTETGASCTPSGCSPVPISERILGRKDGREYGTPLIMDTLERHRIKGTFFVNAYLDAGHDEREIKDAIGAIVARGHDVELHTHEEFRCFKNCSNSDLKCWKACTTSESYLGGNSYDNQKAILAEGIENIRRWSGISPIASRGGSYDADFTTLRALRDLGIKVDSSLASPNHLLASKLPLNQVGSIDGLTEIPLYNFVALRVGDRPLYRHFDIESNTVEEMQSVLKAAAENGAGVVMTILHSFSYCRTMSTCPDERNIARFERLLGWIAAQPEMQAVTVREFLQLYEEAPDALRGSGYVPETGYFLTLHRSIVRFDDGWKNVAFAVANFVAALVCLILVTVVAIYLSKGSGRSNR